MTKPKPRHPRPTARQRRGLQHIVSLVANELQMGPDGSEWVGILETRGSREVAAAADALAYLELLLAD